MIANKLRNTRLVLAKTIDLRQFSDNGNPDLSTIVNVILFQRLNITYTAKQPSSIS